MKGIRSIVGASVVDMGIVTTPQLHWMVRAKNKGLKATQLDYFEQLLASFRCLLDLIPSENKVNKADNKLVVDGANGVGGEKLEVPSENSNKVEVVDGDKILSLFAVFIKKQLSTLKELEDSYKARLGVVQTAYANGASSNYLRQLGLEVVFTPTGVKYLHEKAANYDVGIYFEANGHGTILFSDNFLSWLESKNNELASKSKGSEEHKAALRLLAVSNLINQAVGDALSGLLLVEAILLHMGWSICNWNGLYQDLSSRQIKVKVVDRTAVITTNAETVAVKPPGIQEAINAEIDDRMSRRHAVFELPFEWDREYGYVAEAGNSDSNPCSSVKETPLWDKTQVVKKLHNPGSMVKYVKLVMSAGICIILIPTGNKELPT
ncbi:Phosphoacetylglucosamine mutase [Linum perenne]